MTHNVIIIDGQDLAHRWKKLHSLKVGHQNIIWQSQDHMIITEKMDILLTMGIIISSKDIQITNWKFLISLTGM